MHDTKERLSLLWIFVLLNYLYADVLALFAIVGSQDGGPHLPQWALAGSAALHLAFGGENRDQSLREYSALKEGHGFTRAINASAVDGFSR
jgi:hypothetical protein